MRIKGIFARLTLFTIGFLVCLSFSETVVAEPVAEPGVFDQRKCAKPSEEALARAVGAKPRHYIFTIHGINGDRTTFGDLNDVLTSHLNEIQPEYESQVFTFFYDTGNNVKGTYNFAKAFSKYIKAIYSRQALGPKDKISLITHSQGGLVAWIWYFLSLNNRPGFGCDLPYAQKIDSLITIGTPIWGSKAASLFENHDFLNTILTGLGLLGSGETEEMAHGSNTIHQFRHQAITAQLKEVKINARSLAIAGVLPSFSESEFKKSSMAFRNAVNFFERNHDLNSRAESDLVVNVPNVRLNFLYGETSGADIKFDDFKTFSNDKIAEMVIVKATHSTWKESPISGLADVPFSCLEKHPMCNHPTYAYILNHVLNCKVEKCLDTSWISQTALNPAHLKISDPEIIEPKTLTTFLLDIEYQIPDDMSKRDAKNIDIEFPGRDEGTGYIDFGSYKITIAPPYENMGKIERLMPGKDNVGIESIDRNRYMRFSYYGRIVSSDLSRNFQTGYKMPIIIRQNKKGKKLVEIEAKVRPTYSTFISIRK